MIFLDKFFNAMITDNKKNNNFVRLDVINLNRGSPLLLKYTSEEGKKKTFSENIDDKCL